jgi:hypothetical protein
MWDDRSGELNPLKLFIFIELSPNVSASASATTSDGLHLNTQLMMSRLALHNFAACREQIPKTRV